eukprot:RCo028192
MGSAQSGPRSTTLMVAAAPGPPSRGEEPKEVDPPHQQLVQVANGSSIPLPRRAGSACVEESPAVLGAPAASTSSPKKPSPGKPSNGQVRPRKRAHDDAGLLKYVDYATAVLFSKATAYAKDSALRPPSEELDAMALEWGTTEELRGHWEYVNHPVPTEASPRKWRGELRDSGHEGWGVEEFLARPQARAAGLALVHIVALRLCTGPGRAHINQDLRELKGAFPVTVRMCLTAISMLATAAATGKGAPPAKLYLRGLKGQVNPHFVEAYRALQRPPATEGDRVRHLYGRVLCDLALLSTTADPEVAVQSYAGTNTLFVITPLPASYDTTGLPCAAEVGWVSQFPQDSEWMLPCGTMLYPVPRSERGPPVPPALAGKRKLVLHLYAFALALLPHPAAPHVWYLYEREQEATQQFAFSRVFLKHGFSSAVGAGLLNILEHTAEGHSEVGEDDVALAFSGLATQPPAEGSPVVVHPDAVVPLLERLFECYVDFKATVGETVAGHAKACVELYLAAWRGLPQDRAMELPGFRETWAGMHRAIVARPEPRGWTRLFRCHR